MEIGCDVTEQGVCVIALKGRMHLKDLQEMETTLRGYALGHRYVVVDLSGLDSIFSMCLRSLILCYQAVELRGGRFVLFAPTDSIQAVLRASGIEKIMPVLEDRSAAEAVLFSEGGV